MRTGRVSQPRTVEVRACTGVVPVDLPVGEALEDLVERDPALEPGQRGTEAEVDAVAEAQVLADLAVDVEAVAVGNRRSSRLADPFSSSMTLPSGTVWPWCSTSCAT